MMKKIACLFLILAVTLLFLLSGCGGSDSKKPVSNPESPVEDETPVEDVEDETPVEDVEDETPVEDLEAEIRDDLDALETDVDFTLMVKAENGRVFVHSTGNSSETTLYRSASTSKIVAAATILSLVQKGDLSLNDHPQDYIESWPTTGNLSLIELRHLLNLTSGLANENFCMNRPDIDPEACVENIADENIKSTVPGEEFFYSSSHLQVAGLMAVRALGLTSFQEVFNTFKSETGLFKDSTFDLPSATHPRLAAGMHWHAKDFLNFLDALYHEDILTPDLIQQMTSDQISEATIGFSPAQLRQKQTWHYGFGNWIECHSDTFDCTETTRISSLGAYGSYPFIDYENGYYGIFAREGALLTGNLGYQNFQSVAPKLETWASLNRN